LKTQAELVIKMHDETLEVVLTKSDEELGEWVRRRSRDYADLPSHRRSVFAPTEGVSPSKTTYDIIELRLKLRERYGP
jgi:hypothetical protein